MRDRVVTGLYVGDASLFLEAARQAYVAALVDPAERTAAAGYTNAARHLVRPAGPALASASMAVAVGLPFLVAGGLKVVYDVAIYLMFRRVRLADDGPPPTQPA